jgi:membrane-bound serine protease (ClpP class)
VLVLLLFLVAVAFILIELFLPGGVFGIIGLIAFVASIVVGFQKYPEMGFLIAGGELAVATVLVVIGIKYFPHSYAGKLLILGRRLDRDSGYSGTESLEEYVGAEGISRTHLRPAGIADIGSRRLNVVTEGTFIDKGRQLKVISVEGNRVVVREIEAATEEKEDD